jgi:hypothetical protein
MPRKITIECPRDKDKNYFSYKKQRYLNDLNIFVNDALLFRHLNDAEEYLPLKHSTDLELDGKGIKQIRFEYNISFGPIKEKVDVTFNLLDKNICETNIHRYNFVEGSENLDDDYLVTFDICGQKTFLDKSYHQGNSNDINFKSYYDYPLSIRWYSRKPFTDSKTVYYDDIICRIE